MTIAILCPTRARPVQFKRMCESVSRTATSAISIYSGTNGGDGYAATKYPIDIPTVFMWNDMARIAMKDERNKLFMLGADDMIFATPAWDSALLEHYESLTNKIHVYALQDSRDRDGTPHIFVTREWIEAMGYAFMPIFLHWFIDTWTVEIAKVNGCFTHMRDYMLTHDKPSDRGQPDETHTGIRAKGWHERDAHVNATMQHVLECEKMRLAKVMK